ncbi:MAG: ABC transporter permease [Bacteroidota bacterium]
MKIYLRLLRESVLMAIHALVVNKLRTILSLLGVTIGIFAIIAVFTAVDGLENKIRSSVNEMGSNVVFVEKWPWEFGKDFPWWKYWGRPTANYKEMELLKQRSALGESFAFSATANDVTVKSGKNAIESATVNMVSHEYEKLYAVNLSNGRYFTENESTAGSPVAIIGADVASTLLPGADPVGKSIIVKGRKFFVIGVFVKEGESMLGNSKDKMVMVPVNFARRFLDITSDNLEPRIMVKGKTGIPNSQLIDELRGNLRAIRRLRPADEDNFALNETKLISNQLNSLFAMLTKAGWIIGSFSILVGGFGIANIMFVSVKERTPIIGIQKSLGAKNFFILFQFLAESVFLCLVGGLIGLFLVYLGTLAGKYAGLNLPLSFANIVLGLSVSVIVGVISGLIPAFQASRLDPVEAIRSSG